MSVKLADLYTMSEAEKKKLSNEELFRLKEEAEALLYANPLVMNVNVITTYDVEEIVSDESNYSPLVRTKEFEVL